jgi:hypothetical protein
VADLNAMVINEEVWSYFRQRYPEAILFFEHPDGFLIAYDEDAWLVVLTLGKVGWGVIPPFQREGPALPEGINLESTPVLYVVRQDLAHERLAILQREKVPYIILQRVG